MLHQAGYREFSDVALSLVAQVISSNPAYVQYALDLLNKVQVRPGNGCPRPVPCVRTPRGCPASAATRASGRGRPAPAAQEERGRAVHEPEAFGAIVDQAKGALAA